MSRMIMCAVALLLGLVWQGALLAGDLTAEKRRELEHAALAGSGAAAREVALFHGTKNEPLFEYWSWIGAENGDPICQYNYASMLRGKGDSYSRARAYFWMKKAAERKVKFAEDSLREWKQNEVR